VLSPSPSAGETDACRVRGIACQVRRRQSVPTGGPRCYPNADDSPDRKAKATYFLGRERRSTNRRNNGGLKRTDHVLSCRSRCGAGGFKASECLICWRTIWLFDLGCTRRERTPNWTAAAQGMRSSNSVRSGVSPTRSARSQGAHPAAGYRLTVIRHVPAMGAAR
jgi:hypothetical protein